MIMLGGEAPELRSGHGIIDLANDERPTATIAFFPPAAKIAPYAYV